jgi:hypothetical protein
MLKKKPKKSQQIEMYTAASFFQRSAERRKKDPRSGDDQNPSGSPHRLKKNSNLSVNIFKGSLGGYSPVFLDVAWLNGVAELPGRPPSGCAAKSGHVPSTSNRWSVRGVSL